MLSKNVVAQFFTVFKADILIKYALDLILRFMLSCS